ncbi:flavin reductase [Amycolatopsis sp. WAC 04182]|uniref:flavin reductase family protein n=1 Tax=Amycolatopsis sp. WAC 04182 TaxID=2203198 RepID=UPI000F795506|nr:flavin reductase family protein [Amycolatopsis sp. WAC 04182]RSN62631.1 flavin reductase [Amycolatopsis sp. WAC 04182]
MNRAIHGLRDCLGQFATGVTVVTVRHEGAVHGATVNAFASISLAPPLVMVSLDRRSRLCGRLAGAAFEINILSSWQQGIARHFAGKGTDPAAEIRWDALPHSLRLAGCAAYLTCAPWASYDGGDHVLYLGEVRNFEIRGGPPLVFHRGNFHELRQTAALAPSTDGTGILR